MTSSNFASWLRAHGCIWTTPRNHGHIDYAKARKLLGYSVGQLKRMVSGRAAVSRLVIARMREIDGGVLSIHYEEA